jgi:ATP-binding cassette, subfamily B, bacterial
MFKTLKICWEVFKIAWAANGILFPLTIFSRIYESTIYPFIQVLLLSKILDMLGKSSHITLNDIYWIIVCYISASLIKIIMTAFLDTKEMIIASQQENYIQLQIDKKLVELDPATFESSKFQNLLAQMDGVNETIGAFILRCLGVLDNVFKIITASVVLMQNYAWFIPLIFLSSVPSFLAMNYERNLIWPFVTTERAKLSRISQYIKNLLSLDSSSKEVTIFNVGLILIGKIQEFQKKYFRKFNISANKGIFWVISTRMLQFFVFIWTQYATVQNVLAGSLGIGQFTLCFQQTFNLALGAEGVLDYYSSLAMRLKYIEQYFEFMNTKRMITSPQNHTELPATPMPPIIEFKNVSFRYPNNERNILHKFNITINPGEKIALVGENGAGKTTIIKLLLRFYDVTEGEILINNINIKELSLKQWHSYIGALFQDFIRYQFTLKENIIFGNAEEKNKKERIETAVKQSGTDGYVETLPKKYDQIVGKMFDHGIDLSGGQWQKLALARAFFRNAPLLILDEPTSAIDAKAEFEIFERVQSLQRDKTVIIISHRFSTVRNADRIFVLNDGKIIENGDHEALMEKNGLYAELFHIQAQGYK